MSMIWLKWWYRGINFTIIAAAICNQTHALRRKSSEEIRPIKAEKPIERSYSGVFNDSFWANFSV